MKKAFGACGVFLLFTGMGVQSGWASPGAAVPPVCMDGSEQLDRRITGRVTDTTGEPVVGANVSVKGTTTGVVTDADGVFSIEAQPGSRIEISFIGMRTKTILLTGETRLTVVLAENSELLNEVVVVGYGTQKKANLTGAVASVSSDVLESRPITNLSQGLQGMIGNLNISADNGVPGKGYDFNVRGTTSINSAGPLVLVDGVQMDPNMINPADVESISVLKDAASASIYGTQAAYGVVLITTKRGKTKNRLFRCRLTGPSIHPLANRSISIRGHSPTSIILRIAIRVETITTIRITWSIFMPITPTRSTTCPCLSTRLIRISTCIAEIPTG